MNQFEQQKREIYNIIKKLPLNDAVNVMSEMLLVLISGYPAKDQEQVKDCIREMLSTVELPDNSIEHQASQAPHH